VIEAQKADIESGTYILGPEVEAFESEFADYLGAAHCAGVANGTDAITIALRALGIGPGDEVIVPALIFYASVEAIVNAGATPVLCDVDPDTYRMTAWARRARDAPGRNRGRRVLLPSLRGPCRGPRRARLGALRCGHRRPRTGSPPWPNTRPTAPLPGAEQATEHCLALPMGPALSVEDAAAVAAAVDEALAA
jgi:dTDP-4-amino-4,6-dideoxygalactose transaminase